MVATTVTVKTVDQEMIARSDMLIEMSEVHERVWKIKDEEPRA